MCVSAPRLRAPHGARRGKSGFFLKKKEVMPPRGVLFGLRPFITTGGMGATAPIIISFRVFHEKSHFVQEPDLSKKPNCKIVRQYPGIYPGPGSLSTVNGPALPPG
jgi:hypothetical protein